MPGTFTPNLNLYKPAHNEVGYDALVDTNFDILDTAAAAGAAVAAGHFNNFASLLHGLTLVIVQPTAVQQGTRNLIYTVPAGKRAIIDPFVWCPNITVGDPGQIEVNPAGYTQNFFITPWNVSLPASGTPASLNAASLLAGGSFAAFPIFEAGDKISWNSAGSNPGAFYAAMVWLFDNSSPLKSARYFLELGTTITPGSLVTLYTVPVGKKALLAEQTGTGSQCGLVKAMQACSAFAYHLYRVPSGSSAIPQNLVGGNTPQRMDILALSNIPAGTAIKIPAMDAGDSLQMRVLAPTTYNVTAISSVTGSQCSLNGTFSNGAANALAGIKVYLDGWNNAGNNGEFTVTASTATILTLAGSTFVGESRSTSVAVSLFTLSAAANASGGSTVYTGIMGPGVGANALLGAQVIIAGFSTPANNGTFVITGNGSTTIGVNNPNGVAETHAATAQWLGPRTNNDIVTAPGSLAIWLNFIVEF